MTAYYAPLSGWKYTSYSYDALGRVTTQTNPDDTTISTDYAYAWQTTVTDALGHKKNYYYDAFQRLTKVEELNDSQQVYATTNYSYDILGNLIQVIDNSSNTTTITYDWLSRKTGMTDPDMGSWSYGYDSNGNLTTQTDAKSQTITMIYDAMNRLTKKNYSAATSEVIAISQWGGNAYTAYIDDASLSVMENLLTNSGFENGNPPVGWTDWQATGSRDGTKSKTGSYSLKTILTNTDGGSYQTVVGYSALGGKTCTFEAWVWSSVPNEAYLQFNDGTSWYNSSFHPGDSQWHKLSVTGMVVNNPPYVNAACLSHGSIGDTAYFDDVSWFIATNLLTNSGFESGNPPTGWNFWAGGSETFSQSNAQAKTGSYSGAYNISDGNASVIYQTVPVTPGNTYTFGMWVYAPSSSYNGGTGLAIGMEDNGWSYWGATKTFITGNSAWQWVMVTKTIPADITYTYDSTDGGNYGKGLRTGMTDAAGTTSYKYDARGREIEEKRTLDSVDYITSFSYDGADRTVTITYPTGEVVTQEYNGRGLSDELSGSTAGDLVTEIIYNGLGLITQLNLGNGLKTTYGYYGTGGTYDTTGGYYGRLWEIKTLPQAGGTALQDTRYTWDAVGNMSTRQDVLASETETFGYDFLDRLTSVSGAYSQSYSYNQIGNITSMNGASYTYGTKPHAVTAVGSTAYTYDANGNMTTRGFQSIVWDVENKPVSVGANWYIDTNHSGVFDAGTDSWMGPFGPESTDKPLAVDWDGNGTQELAIFHLGGTWFIDTNRNGVYDSGTDWTNSPYTFGSQTSDKPVAIDWDGNGTQELAIFRSGGTWYIDVNHTGNFDAGTDWTNYPYTFGSQSADIPVAIDWNGDGRQELAIYPLWYLVYRPES